MGIDAFTNIVIAYEPVWAIGTGVTATPEQAQNVHSFIRDLLSKQSENIANSVSILYGGIMNPGDAAELMACEDIDGGLIGGASLKAEDVIQICNAYNDISNHINYSCASSARANYSYFNATR